MLEFPVFSFHLDFLKCWQARRILESPKWNNLNSRKKKKKSPQDTDKRRFSPKELSIQITAQVGEEKEGYNFSGSWSGYVHILCLGPEETHIYC